MNNINELLFQVVQSSDNTGVDSCHGLKVNGGRKLKLRIRMEEREVESGREREMICEVGLIREGR